MSSFLISGKTDKKLAAFVAFVLFVVLTLQMPSIIFIKNGDIRDVFEILFQTGIILALAVFIAARINVWVGAFLFLSLFSHFYPKYSNFSLEALYMVTLGCTWYMILVQSVSSDYLEWLYMAIRLAVLAHVFFVVLQYFNIDPVHKPVGGGPGDIETGLLDNINAASAMIAFGFAFFMERPWVWLTPLLIVGFVFVSSFGGVLAVAIGLIFYAGTKGRKFWPGALLFGGLIAFAKTVDFPGISSRWEAWKEVTALIFSGNITRHLLVGSGIGHWKEIVPNVTSLSGWHQAHNDIFQGFFEMGLLFPVILLGFMLDAWTRYKAEYSRAVIPMMALIIIFVNSLVNFPWHIARLAFLMITILAILEIQLRGFENETI